MERHRLLMFTSCGWFFDDLAGLEPVQNLRYAAMAMQYLRELGGPDLEPPFVDRLGAAAGNDPEEGTGADVYRRRVRPAVADVRRLTAHYAINGLFEPPPAESRVYAYRVTSLEEASESYGDTALRVGRVRVTSEMTGQVRDALYAVAHFGGHDITCGVRLGADPAAYEVLRHDLLGRYAQRSLSEVVRGFDAAFGRDTFSVTDLFLEERRRVLGALLGKVIARHESTVRHVWDETHALLDYLQQAEVPIPETLRVVARRVLEQDALDALTEVESALAIPGRVLELLARARKLHLTLDLTAARPLILGAVERAIDRVARAPAEAAVAEAVALVDGARRLGGGGGDWAAQNRLFTLWTERPDARPVLAPLARALGLAP